MNHGLYPKLAWTGIEKNKKLYYPYFVAAIAMVTVFYIFSFLGESDIINNLPGKEYLLVMFQCGSWAVGAFSVPFLFYTSSSLVKKRKKELGLYNILGMNKKNIFYLLFWETLMTYGIVVVGGIVFGVLLSKAAELGLLNIMDRAVNYYIYVEWKSVLTAIVVFAGIFLLILLNMMRQIRDNNPIELLHSDSAGERPPKGSLILAAASLVLIVAGYDIVSKLDLTLSFQKMGVAAVLIIIGTFLIFICASVYLCKRLQKNQRYYYQTSHFITVSTMSYRMKRNGASLAVICILITFILVMFSFSVSFYAGSMEVIEDHYPYDIGTVIEIPTKNLKGEMASKTYTNRYQSQIEDITDGKDVKSTECYSMNMLAMIVDGKLDLTHDMRNTWFEPGSGFYPGWEEGNQKIVWLRTISLKDYNKLCHTSLKLNADEVYAASESVENLSGEMTKYNGEKVKVKGITEQIPNMTVARLDGDNLDAHGCEILFLVVPDLYSFMGKEDGALLCSERNYMRIQYDYGIDMEQKDNTMSKLYDAINEAVTKTAEAAKDQRVSCYSQEEKGARYYGLSGGLLFLAVMINILVLFVTVLIMYYKQISEGYEDQKRFSIMRKIGMTTEEIKKSIYSQVVITFLLPLILAGIHLIFTRNIVFLLLSFAIMENTVLAMKVMAITYIFFAVVYAFIYLLTSKTYFNIVNQSVNE
ncbi:MAG: FtsX-like permease family protein [Lachnospiraceae bacterium]|nr:FtsX-like permease family protein [Lachnospiraceae bacterium]